MLAHEVHAATDVTGFGLLGHLHNLLRASGVAAELRADDVPLLALAAELASRDAVPGGTKRNLESVAPHTTFADRVDQVLRLLLADAQTSGGLLMAVPSDHVAGLLASLRERRTPAAAVIGKVVRGAPGAIAVV
jgi:selenide,water dikinase